MGTTHLERWLVALAAATCLAANCDPGGGGPDGGGPDGGAGSAGTTPDAGAGTAGVGATGGAGAGATGGGAGTSGSGGTPGGSGGATGGTSGTDAGTDSAAGASGGGLGGSSGAAATGGTGGIPIPPGCGDATRAIETEECDAPGVVACSEACRVTAFPAAIAAPFDGAAERPARVLGAGRHTVAAGDQGFAVVMIESHVVAAPTVDIQRFDANGARSSSLRPVADAFPISAPVLAALPAGRYVAAWTDAALDGDEAGVGLVVDGPTVEDRSAVANASRAFAQRDPDVVWTGTELVVAWTDDASFATAPDVRFRTFDANLDATATTDQALAKTAAGEGEVSLAGGAGTWHAAWRCTSGGSEWTSVRRGPAGSVVSTTPYLPGAPGERLAIGVVDASHVLVVGSEGTDPQGTGVAAVPQLWAALVDLTASVNAERWSLDLGGPGTGGDHEPSLTWADDRWVLAWRRDAPTGDAVGDEVHFAEITLDASPGASSPIQAIPLTSWLRLPDLGDQRRPGVAALGGRAMVAWEDWSEVLGPVAGAPEVVVEVFPLPIHWLSGGGS